MRVRIPERRYYYPDIVVVCGEPQLEDSAFDTLLNPTLVLEVLSESTEKRDRGEKFDGYRTIAALQTYVLVAQDSPRVEIYTRHADGAWRYEAAVGLEAELELSSVGCRLRLTDIYERVSFASEESESAEDRKK
jgi:Uma2 family endonuclease